jgi:hypothetical protein
MRCDVFINSKILLVIEFLNLKIRSSQSFKSVHKSGVCACVYKNKYSYVYKNICLYCIFQKRIDQSLKF